MKQESNILYIQIHKKNAGKHFCEGKNCVHNYLSRSRKFIFIQMQFFHDLFYIFSHFEQVHIFYLTNLSIC